PQLCERPIRAAVERRPWQRSRHTYLGFRYVDGHGRFSARRGVSSASSSCSITARHREMLVEAAVILSAPQGASTCLPRPPRSLFLLLYSSCPKPNGNVPAERRPAPSRPGSTSPGRQWTLTR